jgi:O-antigen/teichoic acid export membrane protein
MRGLIGSRIASNVIANASVAVVNGVIGILTVALLARELGPERYGVWVLIGLVTTYLVLGDLGLISATGRRLAMHQSQEDRSRAARIASTHVAASLALAVIVLLVATAAGWFFGALFAVPPALQREAFGGLLLTGTSTALYIVFSIFNCQLWARERLDVIAAIEIPVQIGKLLAILLLIDPNAPLTLLAAITIPANLASGLAAMAACRRLGIRPGIKLSLASGAELRETWRLGLRLFAYQFTRTANLLTGATIAGNRLGPAAVTSYSLARVLVTYAATFVDTAAQAVAARAVRLHSGGEADQQRELFKLGGRYAAGLAAFFLGGFLALGEPFMRLWQGGRHDEAIALLLVLAVGESLAMSQSVTTAVLLGMNRQVSLLKLALAEIATAALLGIILSQRFGVLGLCLGVAAASLLVRGLGQIIIGCSALKLPVLAYVGRTIVPALLCAIPATLATFWLSRHLGVGSWAGFVAAGGVYAVLFAAPFLALLRSRS